MRESRSQRADGIVAYASDFLDGDVLDLGAYRDAIDEAEMDDPIAFATKESTDPDVMYMDEALQATDAHEFRKSMKKEASEHAKRQHWAVVKKADIPLGTRILPAM